jgi:hypothetical protein
LHLASPFLITAGSNADFTIDVELRKALTDPVGQNHYLLRPALRLVNNVEVGTISGTVDSTLLDGVDETCANDLTADEGNDVYLYIEFVQPQNVTVEAGQETVIDFTAAAP